MSRKTPRDTRPAWNCFISPKAARSASLRRAGCGSSENWGATMCRRVSLELWRRAILAAYNSAFCEQAEKSVSTRMFCTGISVFAYGTISLALHWMRAVQHISFQEWQVKPFAYIEGVAVICDKLRPHATQP